MSCDRPSLGHAIADSSASSTVMIRGGVLKRESDKESRQGIVALNDFELES